MVLKRMLYRAAEVLLGEMGIMLRWTLPDGYLTELLYYMEDC